MQVAHVRSSVFLSLTTDVENFSTSAPTEAPTAAVTPMLDQPVRWTRALQHARSEEMAAAVRAVDTGRMTTTRRTDGSAR